MTLSNEAELFNVLRKKKKDVLLGLLKSSYAVMKSKQRSQVFDDIIYQSITAKKSFNERKVLNEVNNFYKQSLAGRYYAPFDINSKNFMELPEETDEWCNQIALFLEKSSQLTKLGKHETAVKCFQMLFELMDRICDDEIVFGDEIGTWMIGADEENAIKAYITSLTQTATVQEFIEHATPLLIRDGQESFRNKAYAKIKTLAKKKQKDELDKVIKNRGIKIKNKEDN
jgi:hypothetical protein